MMHKYDAHKHNGIPDDETHDGIGTSAGIRLFDCINTWKAFVSVLALCLIINGLLFYLS
jgi:hypothetical protein